MIKFLILQNVLFYLVSDDYDTAKKYVLTEKNRHYNIVLPYTGVRKVPGKIMYILHYMYFQMVFHNLFQRLPCYILKIIFFQRLI